MSYSFNKPCTINWNELPENCGIFLHILVPLQKLELPVIPYLLSRCVNSELLFDSSILFSTGPYIDYLIDHYLEKNLGSRTIR